MGCHPSHWRTHMFQDDQDGYFIELDDGKIYRKALYLMVKTMVSCRFSLKPIQWLLHNQPETPRKNGGSSVAAEKSGETSRTSMLKNL